MKRIYTLLLILFIITHISAQNISLSMKNVSLHEILLELKRQSGNNIVYNNNLLEKYSNESIELKNTTFEQALTQALAGKALMYKNVDNVYVIEPQTEWNENPKELSQTVKGTVSDAETSIPLAGATIVITELDPAYRFQCRSQWKF